MFSEDVVGLVEEMGFQHTSELFSTDGCWAEVDKKDRSTELCWKASILVNIGFGGKLNAVIPLFSILTASQSLTTTIQYGETAVMIYSISPIWTQPLANAQNEPFSDWQTAIQTWRHATRQDADPADAVSANSDGRKNKRNDVMCYSAFHIWQNTKFSTHNDSMLRHTVC